MEEIIDGKVKVIQREIKSMHLNRNVKLTILLPELDEIIPLPVLWLNDGQDIPALNLTQLINHLFFHNRIKPFILVGIHANESRLDEYGTISMPDYANRGNKAQLYAKFLLQELMPLLKKHFLMSELVTENVIAGFSLGGLSALDIAWNYPKMFGKVGVFSGSLWWRKRPINKWYKEDRDRIIHALIRKSKKREGLTFWFECGTNDETNDRNDNGIIDSLDDTIDLIKELKQIGYDKMDDIHFIIVKGGEHNQQTWKDVMPHFLHWAFGNNEF